MEPVKPVKHPDQGVVVRSIERPDPAAIAALAEAYVAFVLDRLGKHGAMHPDLKPLSHGMRVCGPAVTALGPDLTVRRMAIDLAQAGDVLVVAAGGGVDRSCFGDGTAKRMRLKGIAGAVVDGASRDVGRIRELGYPTFARAGRPDNHHYPVSAAYGAVNVPVVCAGVRVEPGDLVMGDDDGVIVVPRRLVPELAKTVAADLRAENAMRAAMTRYEPFDVEAELVALGYRFE